MFIVTISNRTIFIVFSNNAEESEKERAVSHRRLVSFISMVVEDVLHPCDVLIFAQVGASLSPGRWSASFLLGRRRASSFPLR